MTAKWIQKAAEERYPEHPVFTGPYDTDQELKRDGFITGVELGIQRSADIAEEIANEWPEPFRTRSGFRIVNAIRASGSDSEHGKG